MWSRIRLIKTDGSRDGELPGGYVMEVNRNGKTTRTDYGWSLDTRSYALRNLLQRRQPGERFEISDHDEREETTSSSQE
ncbi:hypothetical protein ACFLQN_04600 [Candidatus Aenigmatarchaeota archaeon]